MLFFLPTKHSVNVPSTIMKHYAQLFDPQAVILWGDQATSQNARKAIEELNPPYIFTTGHGIPCATTLQDNQPFISLQVPQMNPKVCDAERNLDIVKGRIWHIHSCWCGRLLAPTLVQKYGAWAVFAHDDEFLFLLPKDGRTIDIIVAAPFLAEFTVDAVMLSGGTAREAQSSRMKAYDYWINYFYHGPGKDLDGAAVVLRILIADKAISKLYGDPTATATTKRQVPKAELTLPITLEGQETSLASVLLPVLVLLLIGGKHGTEEQKGALAIA